MFVFICFVLHVALLCGKKSINLSHWFLRMTFIYLTFLLTLVLLLSHSQPFDSTNGLTNYIATTHESIMVFKEKNVRTFLYEIIRNDSGNMVLCTIVWIDEFKRKLNRICKMFYNFCSHRRLYTIQIHLHTTSQSNEMRKKNNQEPCQHVHMHKYIQQVQIKQAYN